MPCPQSIAANDFTAAVMSAEFLHVYNILWKLIRCCQRMKLKKWQLVNRVMACISLRKKTRVVTIIVCRYVI